METAMSNVVPVDTYDPSSTLGLALPSLGTEALDHGQVNYCTLETLRQTSSRKHRTDSADCTSSNGISDGNTLSTMERAISTPAEEDSFTRLLNNTFNNTSFNDLTNDFQPNDYDDYTSVKELQLQFSSPFLPSITWAPEQASSSEISASGHFTRNNVKTGIQEAYASTIIEMIHAYPRMMTRRETLPPFIHAYSPGTDTASDQTRLPEHLTNCMGIAQLFAVRSHDTQSFLWATIRAEMRGFERRLTTFDKFDSLRALQASLLYFIIRAIDGAPQEAKDDYEMLLIYEVSPDVLSHH